MQEAETRAGKPITPWVLVGLLGVGLIIGSTLIPNMRKTFIALQDFNSKAIVNVPSYQENKFMATLSKIIFGLGTSLLAASSVKHGIDFIDVIHDKIWLHKHIEIMADIRNDAKNKYVAEDKNIIKSLQILSFSAIPVFKDLKQAGTLYDSLVRQNVDIKILIVNWNSQAADQRAKEDNPDDVGKAKTVINDNFNYIKTTYNSLLANLGNEKNISKMGQIEVKVTECNPYLTLYIRDDNTIIFGQYFSHCRGDQNAALIIKKNWNEKVFTQYTSHFIKLWNHEQNKLFFYIRPGEGSEPIEKNLNTNLPMPEDSAHIEIEE